jgi:hypothetical protein
MERGRPLLVGLVAALALAAPAEASLEVRLSVAPSQPRAGKRIVVQLRPYWTYLRPDGSCCRLEPANVAYPFRLEAVSPHGAGRPDPRAPGTEPVPLDYSVHLPYAGPLNPARAALGA